jgi:hypothetical protein
MGEEKADQPVEQVKEPAAASEVKKPDEAAADAAKEADEPAVKDDHLSA